MADASTSSASSGSSKLDQALGDIITSENANRPKRGGRRGGRGGGGSRGERRPQQNGGGRRNPLARGGDYDEEDGDEGGAVRRGRQQFRGTPYSRGDSNGSWSNDMYDSAPSPALSSYVPPAPTVKGDTVFVSNLARDINDEDLHEIFGRIGAITRANVNFNSQAESLGTAEVQFGSGQLAEQAVRELDGAQVDGRAMTVKLVASISRPRAIVPRPQPQQFAQPRPARQLAPRTGGFVPRRNSGGNSQQQRPRNNIRGRGGRGGRGGGRQKSDKPVSATDLDAELDSYQAKRGATSEAAAE